MHGTTRFRYCESDGRSRSTSRNLILTLIFRDLSIKSSATFNTNEFIENYVDEGLDTRMHF